MKKFDVFGVGNPLIDIVTAVDDSFLNKLGIKKGMFNLVDYDKLQYVLKEVKEFIRDIEAGDSTANSIAGVVNLGGTAVYQGCIGYDEYGKLYEEKTINQGIISKLIKVDGHTGVAVAMITPDSERSFATYLGVACSMKKEFLDLNAIKESKYFHVTGYQLEEPLLKEMAVYAMEYAKKNDTKVSLDVADKGVILRNKEFILDLLKKYVDVLYANEDESLALTSKSPYDAVSELGQIVEIACVKIGKKGSLINQNGKIYEISGFNVNAVDTTGAGDMYAAGILYGLSHDYDIITTGKIASFSAAKIVEIYGARPKFNLNELIKEIIKKV